METEVSPGTQGGDATADAPNGAAPGRREHPLLFSQADYGEAELQAVTEVLRSGWLTTGPRVKQFEQEIARYVGAEHAVAVSSGTAALHLALDAIALQPDDEVIVPTYTFTATANVARYFGARPVLVDVRADDLNLDLAAVERAIGPRTRAVIGVDFGGQPCDWHLLRPLAERHGLVLVDDAAHALSSRLQGRPIGAWADMTMFSFYVTKPLATGEGGMLVTDNPEWADRVRTMALHGMSRDAWKRYTAAGSWYYEVIAPGFKYNLGDLAAALGLAQFTRLEAMSARRAEIAARYRAAFSDLPELQLPTLHPDRTTSWHLYPLRLHLERLRCDRAAFI